MDTQERNFHYKRALDMLETDKYPEDISVFLTLRFAEWLTKRSGLCELIATSMGKYHKNINLNDFPELMAVEPAHILGSNGFWWPVEDREIRKDYLKKFIEQTNP